RSATSLRVASVLAAVGKGLKDDLARHPVAGLGSEGAPRICKRIDRADLRTKLPRVNHASSRHELRSVRLTYAVHNADVLADCRSRSDHGDELAARSKHRNPPAR